MQSNNTNEKGILKPRSFRFSLDIIKFLDGLSKGDSSVQVISKQVLRSATSIGANIVEAQSGSSRKDFANFYSHALKSANETKYWLELLKEANKCDVGQADALLKEVNELSNMLASSILTLKNKKIF